MIISHGFFDEKRKKRKRGVDGSCDVCYIMTVAPMRAAGERKQAPALERRRMYPENYTMQNKLEETLTARCNIVVKEQSFGQRNNNSFTRMTF